MNTHIYHPQNRVLTAIPCEVKSRKGEGPRARVLIRFRRNSFEGFRTHWVNAVNVRPARPGESLTVPS
jgi:hypothetical protein